MLKPADNILIAKIAQGSHSAFTKLFDRYSGLVLGYSSRIVGGTEIGQEMAQEVWMKVIRYAPSYKDTGKFKSWLMTITRNVCLSHLRSSKDWEEFADDHYCSEEEENTLEASFIFKDDIKQIKIAVDQLPMNQRLALTLHLTEQLSYEEISNELNLSISSVKSLIFRARETLKSKLDGK